MSVSPMDDELFDAEMTRLFRQLLPDTPVASIEFRSEHSVSVELADDQQSLCCIEFAPGKPITITRIG